MCLCGRVDDGWFEVEMDDDPQLIEPTAVDDEGSVPELPPLPHTGLTASQQENRRLQIGRHVAYIGVKSTKLVPFLVGRITNYDEELKQVGTTRFCPIDIVR